jgi:hypothetical protein
MKTSYCYIVLRQMLTAVHTVSSKPVTEICYSTTKKKPA